MSVCNRFEPGQRATCRRRPSRYDALTGGVAFHNADLTRQERQVLEEELRRGDTKLRVLVATTTRPRA